MKPIITAFMHLGPVRRLCGIRARGETSESKVEGGGWGIGISGVRAISGALPTAVSRQSISSLAMKIS